MEKTILILLFILVPILISYFTKNPPGTSYRSPLYNAENVEFLYDLTYEKNGERIFEQTIFDAETELIRSAKEFILLDIFLYNDDYTKGDIIYPPQVSEMTELLIQKRNENPSMPIILITDPINNFYGAYEQRNLKKLREAGVEVVITDLNMMQDSNYIVSGFYRVYLQWLGTGGIGWIPNLLDKNGPKVNVRSIIKLANFKGNHRKVFVTENSAIVASANPHDPSSLHSNVAIRFYGEAMEDLIKTELILMENPPELISNWKSKKCEESKTKLAVITEEEIYNSLMYNLKKTTEGDKIWIGIFYISEFNVLEELGEATKRGVEVRIVADLNKDAFGLEKNGSPNRPALSELIEKFPSLKVKWYNTTGEQYHTKMAYFEYKDENPIAILGSANFTRRNLRNFNLETDLYLDLEKNSKTHSEIENYFQRIWNNEDAIYTIPMEKYYERSLLLRTLWKIQEKLGLSTW